MTYGGATAPYHQAPPPLAFHKLRILIKLPLNIISYWVGRFYFLIRFYCINIRII